MSETKHVKKIQNYFTLVETQTVIWKTNQDSASDLLYSLANVMSRMDVICARDQDFGVLEQFEDLKVLLKNKHYTRLEALMKALRSVLHSLFKVTEKLDELLSQSQAYYISNSGPKGQLDLNSRSVWSPSIADMLASLTSMAQMYRNEYKEKKALIDSIRYDMDDAAMENLQSLWQTQSNIDNQRFITTP